MYLIRVMSFNEQLQQEFVSVNSETVFKMCINQAVVITVYLQCVTPARV